MPLTSLSDSFVTLPPVALHPWSHAHLFLPSPWSVLVASVLGPFPPTFFSSKYVAVCSQMPRRRKPPTPSPSVPPSSSPPPSITRFRFLTQNVDSPRSTLQMRVGDPKMSITTPTPICKLGLHSRPAGSLHPFPPAHRDTFVHKAFLLPLSHCCLAGPAIAMLVRWRMLRLGVVGHVGTLLFPAGKDR